MRDMIATRWLPADTILGTEVSEATDAALAPLAQHAKRIRRNVIVGTSLLLGSAVALAILAAGPGGGAWKFAALSTAAFGGLLAFRAHRLWNGNEPWAGKRSLQTPGPGLPQLANSLLADLRSGERRARYRRAQSGRDVVIPPQQLRGPFGPLLLSSQPEVQSLALRDWFGGDQLSVELEGIARELPPYGGTEAPARFDARPASAHRLNVDHRLLLAPEALARLLDRAYPPFVRGTRECLIVDALMLGNELVVGGLLPEKIKTLVSRIVAGLKAPDGCPVNLVADDGSVTRAEHLFQHRKAVGTGYATVGLREGSDSSAWIEQAVTGRYPDIRERLDAAEERRRGH